MASHPEEIRDRILEYLNKRSTDKQIKESIACGKDFICMDFVTASHVFCSVSAPLERIKPTPEVQTEFLRVTKNHMNDTYGIQITDAFIGREYYGLFSEKCVYIAFNQEGLKAAKDMNFDGQMSNKLGALPYSLFKGLSLLSKGRRLLRPLT